MKLIYDDKVQVASALRSNQAKWLNKTRMWGELLDDLLVHKRTTESFEQYEAWDSWGAPHSDKFKQGKVMRTEAKESCGCFMLAYLEGGSRNKDKVSWHQGIMLDIDHVKEGVDPWGLFKGAWGCAAAMYTTHSHSAERPRIRLVIPANRRIRTDEYEPVARKIAEMVGIEQFDSTTFQINRMMFLPSASRDGEVAADYVDAPWLDVDAVLAMYTNWKDMSEWAYSARHRDNLRAEYKLLAGRQAADPLTKRGPIGAWCRTYSIDDVMSRELSEVYCSEEGGRYTYIDGSTSKGVVVYDDKFAYSNHGTDPAGGLNNAWDLVRIHKFGKLDKPGAKYEGNDRPSQKAMYEYALGDPEIIKLVTAEKMENGMAAFSGLAFEDFTEPDVAAAREVPGRGGADTSDVVQGIVDTVDLDKWKGELEVDKQGIKKTIFNVVHILSNDPALKGALALNLLNGREMLLRSVPWRKQPVRKGGEYMVDADDSGLRYYLETVYNITGKDKIDDGVSKVMVDNSFHPIRQYLERLAWDGKPRVDRLMCEYLGVEDSVFALTVTRKALVACVARVYKPGCKFDEVLTIKGPQGIGKSTLLEKLGMAWYTDKIGDIETKEALENMQGKWIIELGELASMKRAKVEAVKNFISSTSDYFRKSYGRRAEDHPRQCVFFATTNEDDFLQDRTGNRRWWPVVCDESRVDTPVFDMTQADVDQVWAEAKMLYDRGEVLHLDDDMKLAAAAVQEEHTEVDERVALIKRYLDMLLPADWQDMPRHQRIAYIDQYARVKSEKGAVDPFAEGIDSFAPGTVRRDQVCVAEIWFEVLKGDIKNFVPALTKPIHSLMRNMEGWVKCGDRKYDEYGKQRSYSRQL